MSRLKLTAEIIDIKLAMFLAVNAEGDPSCRNKPDDFRMYRRAQFSVWSEATLKSYLRADLESHSVETLESLWADAVRCIREGINMSEQIYLDLVSNFGLDSLDSFR